MPRGHRKHKDGDSPPHDAHLSDLALSILDVVRAHYRKPGAPRHRKYVFPGDGPDGHIDARAISHAARRVPDELRKSGAVAEPWKPHDLRRTASTRMTKYGDADRLTWARSSGKLTAT